MGESVTIKSYRREREKEILDGLQKSLEKVGRLVEKEAGRNVDKTGNEHPQVQSGNLLGSITHEVGDGEVVIGTNVKYGKYLELGFIQKPGLYIPELKRFTKGGQVGPYPWLFPAVELKKSEIIDILKSSGAKDVSF